MKNLILFTFFSFLSIQTLWAQIPQAFKYQAVARDVNGDIIPNQSIGFRISILQTSPTGSSVYTETHNVASNDFGLVNLEIGAGTTVSGNFSVINWGASSYFIKIEMDASGGNNYLFMGTSQLLSVPYALHALTASSVSNSNDMDSDSTNELQTLSLNGNSLSISNGNSVTLNNGTSYTAGQGININGGTISNSSPDQTVTLSGTGATTVSGTYPNFTINSIDNVNDADADANNEIQTLTLNGNTLSISNGNSVTLNSGTNYTAGQGININGSTISNSSPDQVVSLTGSGTTTVSGTYPNFTISSTSSGVTLDQAYDFGGAGLGRTITTDAGSVQINNFSNTTTALEINSSVANSSAVLANISGIGVGFRAESTNPSNSFSAIQANTNSNNFQNSAIIGNNSGAGYGVTGQITSGGTGSSAVFGNNLRTNGGSGVLGQGFNGVVGQTSNGQGFGVYGSNSLTTGNATNLGIGSYGFGFHGVYGQTTNTSQGWAGYFTADIGVDGAGYALGGWVNASDKRLKSNIVPIQNALDKISKLEGKFYTITTKSRDINGNIKLNSRQQYGVIAQDLEKDFPEMISEKALFNSSGDDTVYKTVEYTQLVPVLIEAVKDLKNQVESLQQELKKLKEEGKK
jgi:hypothetical protein